MAKKGGLIKTFRSIRISDGLIIKIEDWLESKENEKLGIESVKDALEYHARKGLQSINKNRNTAKRVVLLKNPDVKKSSKLKEPENIRISDRLIVSFEIWLETKDAEKAGIDTLKDAMEYFTRLGMKSTIIQR
ncbi:hypothetical protein LCGC14_1723480 [marine sediment metagenome]|uniref:Uncharacterized protein n=1 Tax=marine sediment metagenome TaxID=412755 RepID=A0A0F9JS86_9ZZZZ